LDLELLLRNIDEAEMVRKARNGALNAIFSAKNIIHIEGKSE